MMKKFAKGMAAFLMVFMALTLLAPICHAAEEDTSYTAEVHVTHTPVKVEVYDVNHIDTPYNWDIKDEFVYFGCIALFFFIAFIMVNLSLKIADEHRWQRHNKKEKWEW